MYLFLMNSSTEIMVLKLTHRYSIRIREFSVQVWVHKRGRCVLIIQIHWDKRDINPILGPSSRSSELIIDNQ